MYNRSVHLVIKKILFKIILCFLPAFHIKLAGEISAREEENQLVRERVKQIKEIIKENKDL